MQSNTEWMLGSRAWSLFAEQHPELGLKAIGSTTLLDYANLYRQQRRSSRCGRDRWLVPQPLGRAVRRRW